MKKKILSLFALLFIVLPCLMLTACIGAGDPPDDNPPQTPETEVNITYVLNGQTIETKKSSKSSINTPINVSLPGGYGLEGWYLDNNTFTNKLDESDINETDLTVYAKVKELFTIDNKVLTAFNDNNATSFTVPEGVEIIGDRVFEDNITIQNIVLPNGLKEIGMSAFRGCTALTNINIPDTLTELYHYAFRGCSSLRSRITIPEGITTIFAGTFQFCSSLEDVYLPTTLKTIEESAFKQTAILSINLPEGLETIGEECFYGCSLLREISIPNSVRTIAEKAFFQCSELWRVDLGTGLLTIGQEAFGKCYKIKGVWINGEQTDVEWGAFDNSCNLSWVCIASQEIVNRLNPGNLVNVFLKSESIYIKQGLSVVNATTLLSDYTNYSNSDISGYIKYTKNP